MSPPSLPSSRLWGAWAAALLSGALAMQLAHFCYRTLPRPQPLAELSYYPSGVALRPATLGQVETAADLAWLRAVQYYGGHRLGDNHFPQLEHVFDILTSLSPHFIPAYVFGAFALSQEGGDFEAGERLILQGIENNPRSGELAFQLGFLYYVKPGGRDLRNAARYFEQASWQPDAPPLATRFAAFSRQESGDLSVAYQLWSDVFLHSANAYLREMAQDRMREIEAALRSGRKDLAVRRLATPQVILRP